MPETKNRFIHDGREMGEWLLQLVNEDEGDRKAAARVILNQFFMPVDLIRRQNEPCEAIWEQFRAAVRSALRKPDFPAAEFVQNLLARYIAIHESWISRKSKKFGEHEISTTWAAIHHVIESLGKELLPAAHYIRQTLHGPGKMDWASAAIGRMGREGMEFYQDLLDALKEGDPNFDCGTTLGLLLRSVPERIGEIFRLASDADFKIRINAVAALGHCGRPAAVQFPEIEVWLRQRLENCRGDRESYGLIFALGEIGKTTETVSLLLEFLDSSDPCETGSAIEALGRLGREPDRVVPLLAGRLDTFEEFDPDCSDHERVIGALRCFGSAAKPAVPCLIRHVWSKPYEGLEAQPKEPDTEVIRFLGELGTMAKEALPALIEVRKVVRARAEKDSGVNDEDDYLDLAIKKIQQTA